MSDEIIKYVINPETFGNKSYILTQMSDGIHSDDKGLTIDEIRKVNNDHRLIAVSSTEMEEYWRKYEISLWIPFEEISVEQYVQYENCVPPLRHSRNSFFVGTECFNSTHLFCFILDDRYFAGHRSMHLSNDKLQAEIIEFRRYLHEPTEEEINLYHPNVVCTDPDNLQFCLQLSETKFWYCQFDTRQFFEATYSRDEELYNQYEGNPEQMFLDAKKDVEVKLFIENTSNWISELMDASTYSEEKKRELLESFDFDWDEYTEEGRNQLACEVDFEVNTMNN